MKGKIDKQILIVGFLAVNPGSVVGASLENKVRKIIQLSHIVVLFTMTTTLLRYYLFL